MKLARLITFFLILFLFQTVFPSSGFAKEEKIATSGAGKKIEYNLPYPGILPDHPLYFLKTLRDQVLGWFITDSLKKPEFDLLLADKRLGSGVSLLERGNATLGASTFLEGEQYLQRAVDETKAAQKSGRDTKALISKLSLATLKHQDVLTVSLAKAPESVKAEIQRALEKSRQATETLRDMQTRRLQESVREKILGKRPTKYGERNR